MDVEGDKIPLHARGQRLEVDVDFILAGGEVESEVLQDGYRLQRWCGEALCDAFALCRPELAVGALLAAVEAELGVRISGVVLVFVLHGIINVEHLVDGVVLHISALCDGGGVDGCPPHCKFVHVALEETAWLHLVVHDDLACADEEVRGGKCGHLRFSDGLHSLSVDEEVGRDSPSHVECDVVPLAVVVVHIAEHGGVAVGVERRLSSVGAQDECLRLVEVYRHPVGQGDE